MPTLAEILDDPKGYPNDRKITLEGVDTTLGELRGGYLKDADYRQKTTALARERDSFSREKADFEQARTDAEAQLARLAEAALQKATPTGTAPTPDDVEQYLQKDPVAARLVARIEKLNTRLDEVAKKDTEREAQVRAQQEAYVADLHHRAMQTIAQRDPYFADPAKREEFTKWAVAQGIPRVDWAYSHYLVTQGLLDARVKEAEGKAKETASKEAYDKARKELASPVIPARRVIQTTLAEGAPKTFDEAQDAAMRDPEILSLLEGYSGRE